MQENENSQHYTSRNWKIRGIIFLTGKGMRESGAPPPHIPDQRTSCSNEVSCNSDSEIKMLPT